MAKGGAYVTPIAECQLCALCRTFELSKSLLKAVVSLFILLATAKGSHSCRTVAGEKLVD